MNDCIEYEDMPIDDEDAARMSGRTAGGASSSYGLNEDDEEAYLYGDVEVEDADMEIEAETFPGDAGAVSYTHLDVYKRQADNCAQIAGDA